MFEYLYRWMENISFYLVILTVTIQLIPNNNYKKYIRFFTGLILVLMLLGPVMKLFDIEKTFYSYYENAEYERKMREIENATKYLEDISFEN